MAKKLINTIVKLGEGTLLLEALTSLGIDFPIEWVEDYSWVKWNSGKLVCEFIDTQTNVNLTELSSGWFRSQQLKANFPISFKTINYISVPSSMGAVAYSSYNENYTTDYVNYRLLRTAGGLSNQTTNSHFQVIGTWK